MNNFFVAALLALSVSVSPAFANKWKLDQDESMVSFGSIKNDYVGEAHTFDDLSGGVDKEGNVKIEIGLNSLETNIDIRNERMLTHVFDALEGVSVATLTASVDLKALEKMKTGKSDVFEVDAVLNLLGNEVDVYMEMYVLRLSPRRVLVTSHVPSFVSTDDLAVDVGIDKLQELASLDGITRVTPLTARFVFER